MVLIGVDCMSGKSEPGATSQDDFSMTRRRWDDVRGMTEKNFIVTGLQQNKFLHPLQHPSGCPSQFVVGIGLMGRRDSWTSGAVADVLMPGTCQLA